MKRGSPKYDVDIRSSPYSTVDEYLSLVPEEPRACLEKVRENIMLAAPEAVERISYGIPVFFQNGILVGYSVSKRYCSFHLVSSAVMEMFRERLEGFDTTKVTVHFDHLNPISPILVQDIVRTRVAENGSAMGGEPRRSRDRTPSEGCGPLEKK